MGKFAYRLITFAAFAFVLWLTLSSASAQETEPFDACRKADKSCPLYLNIITRRGTAQVSTSTHCKAPREHVWGINDARNKFTLWHAENMAKASGGVCIRLFPTASAVIIAPVGGSCGVPGNYFNPPSTTVGADVRDLKVLILGCRTVNHGKQLGGIAFRLEDGYAFGDFYAQGEFYSTYDSYGEIGNLPGDENNSLRHFNSYTYEIIIEPRPSADPNDKEKQL